MYILILFVAIAAEFFYNHFKQEACQEHKYFTKK